MIAIDLHVMFSMSRKISLKKWQQQEDEEGKSIKSGAK